MSIDFKIFLIFFDYFGIKSIGLVYIIIRVLQLNLYVNNGII